MKDKKIAFAQAFASHMATLSNEQQEAFTRNSYIDTRQVADRARAALLSGLGDKESVSRKTLWEVMDEGRREKKLEDARMLAADIRSKL